MYASSIYSNFSEFYFRVWVHTLRDLLAWKIAVEILDTRETRLEWITLTSRKDWLLLKLNYGYSIWETNWKLKLQMQVKCVTICNSVQSHLPLFWIREFHAHIPWRCQQAPLVQKDYQAYAPLIVYCSLIHRLLEERAWEQGYSLLSACTIAAANILFWNYTCILTTWILVSQLQVSNAETIVTHIRL